MPHLPARRKSLCLFCTIVNRPQWQYYRFFSQSQNVNRVGGRADKKRAVRHSDSSSHRPLRIPPQTFHQDQRTNKFDFRKHLKNTPLTIAGLRQQVELLREEFLAQEQLDTLQLTREQFDEEWLTFERFINSSIKQQSPLFKELSSNGRGGSRTSKSKLRHEFFNQVIGGRFTQAELENQTKVADLCYPSEWYPATRQIPRTIHMHVGPTNSGKTYHALKRLEAAERGIYLGPLRLLAHEVYSRLNASGKPCALITGEEQRMPEGQKTNMWSCTVEMAPLNTQIDVAVIDEIQMINHPERGWAWTQAFLGLQAREIHLCGEARTVPLMRELCTLIGDKIHVHEYERLTPLKVQSQSLQGDLSRLEKGDCVVCFTILGIHALRRMIEKKTGKKCAIVYGSLPPETRAQQARLFNDPDNDYDFLVASDAIGMGLNLAVKRIIFESTVKSNGSHYVRLAISDMKQIGGRAGRYKTAHQAITSDEAQISGNPAVYLDVKKPRPKTQDVGTIGWITTLDRDDHLYLDQAMKLEPEPIATAGLFPPSLIVERFANYFPPGTPFSYIMLRLHEISVIHPRFHLCGLKDQLAIADTIHSVKNLSIQDRITICAAPANLRDRNEGEFLKSLAECIADGKSGHLLDLEKLPLDIMDMPPSAGRDYLRSLEQLHKLIVCYLWLSYRFPNIFITRTLANYTKQLVEDRIENTLKDFSFTTEALNKIKAARKAARLQLDADSKTDVLAEVEDQQTSTLIPVRDVADNNEKPVNATLESAATPNDNRKYMEMSQDGEAAKGLFRVESKMYRTAEYSLSATGFRDGKLSTIL